MKTTQSFSILIWADKRKEDVNGFLPLYARVTVGGKRAEISLKKKVSQAKWDARTGFLKGNTEDIRSTNNLINQATNDLSQIYRDMQRKGEFISAEQIKLQYTGVPVNQKRLLEIFDLHNRQMKELVGIDVVKATLTKYHTVRKKVADYIQHQYQKPDLYIEKLDYAFIAGFEHYLKTKVGIDHNTTMRYITNVKKIINNAVNHKWLKADPFAGFKCTSRKVNREALTTEEIQRLTEKKFKVKRLEEVRDVFLFCCYTGYAFVDAEKLTLACIVKGHDGEQWIKVNRTKTDVRSNVSLLPQALAIIKKYERHEECLVKGRLLPVKSNQKMNAYLKEIADLCGIEKNMTMHIARHTFATTVTLANGVPIETVSKMLGHTKITTTQIYAKVLEDKISSDMQALKLKLLKAELV